MAEETLTVEQYLQGLPAERRRTMEAIREVILKSLPQGYEEGIQYRMIGYFVPHRIYPSGYHCDRSQPLPFVQIGSQKNHTGLYLFCIYGNSDLEQWFREEWKKTGKKLDMGKACIRVKKLEDVPLKLIGRLVKKLPVKKYIAHYESNLANTGSQRKPKPKSANNSVKSAATEPRSPPKLVRQSSSADSRANQPAKSARKN